jgi:(2Fe-2S) ferredoxin
VQGAPGAKPTPLAPCGDGEPPPAVVVVRRDGAWYPSLTFSAADALLANVEREHK